jgi:LysM repeat protein
MDDKEIRDREKTLEEIDEEDLEEFDPDEEYELFEEGRGKPFESREDQETEEAGDEPDDTDPDELDEEMAYESARNRNEGLLSRLFQAPRVSAGWIGLLLIILIMLVLFMPRGSRKSDDGDLQTINMRIGYLEEQLAGLATLAQRVDELQMKSGPENERRIADRMDNLEKTLAAMTGQLQGDLEAIRKKLAAPAPKPAKTVQKAEPGPKAQAPAAKTKTADTAKYYTVKKGENLFRIALNHGLTEAQLLSLNGLNAGVVIHPGQKLKVSR